MPPANAGSVRPEGVKLLCQVRLKCPGAVISASYTWISSVCAHAGADQPHSTASSSAPRTRGPLSGARDGHIGRSRPLMRALCGRASLRVGAREWQRHCHRETGARCGRGELDLAAEQLHHPSDNREPEAAAARGAAGYPVEALESAGALGRRNPRSVVADREERVALGRGHLERYAAACAYVTDGILEQVAQQQIQDFGRTRHLVVAAGHCDRDLLVARTRGQILHEQIDDPPRL